MQLAGVVAQTCALAGWVRHPASGRLQRRRRLAWALVAGVQGWGRPGAWVGLCMLRRAGSGAARTRSWATRLVVLRIPLRLFVRVAFRAGLWQELAAGERTDERMARRLLLDVPWVRRWLQRASLRHGELRSGWFCHLLFGPMFVCDAASRFGHACALCGCHMCSQCACCRSLL
jgi:hypothetical protein